MLRSWSPPHPRAQRLKSRYAGPYAPTATPCRRITFYSDGVQASTAGEITMTNATNVQPVVVGIDGSARGATCRSVGRGRAATPRVYHR